MRTRPKLIIISSRFRLAREILCRGDLRMQPFSSRFESTRGVAVWSEHRERRSIWPVGVPSPKVWLLQSKYEQNSLLLDEGELSSYLV